MNRPPLVPADTRTRRWRDVLAWVGIATFVLTGCTSTGRTEHAPEDGPGAPSGEITVLAAASLTDVFARLAAAFERQHPGVRVELSFGPSSGLARSINQGAPADVFASADREMMRRVTDTGVAAGEPRVFARNRLQVAVPKGNPARVSELADFADEDLLIALCAQEVPCGRAAAATFADAGIDPKPDTFGRDVRAVLTAIRTGEVDAGLVYRSDVASNDEVMGVLAPATDQRRLNAAANAYPIVVLRPASDAAKARAFVDFVLADTGQRILADAEFDPA